MTVARMSRSECYKGHDVVLRALPSVLGKISNLIYAVVGEGDDRPRLEALTKELGLSQYVVFTRRVTDSELVNLYQPSEVFLLPATTVIDEHNPKGEGFGIVYFEAMAFGIPVIGPNCGAPAEFIQHQRHGLLVDSEVPESVAEALLHPPLPRPSSAMSPIPPLPTLPTHPFLSDPPAGRITTYCPLWFRKTAER